MAKKTPTLCEHGSGNAYAKIGGRQVWFGRYELMETHDKFALFIGDWVRQGRPSLIKDVPVDDLLVRDLVARYLAYVEKRYVRKDGSITGEQKNIVNAVRELLRMFGGVRVHDFKLKELKRVRANLVERELGRETINAYMGRVVRVFGWGEEEDLVPEETWASVRALQRLKKGRCIAPDYDPVQPVSWSQVERLLPFLRPQVAAMVQLQWWCGCRPGEIVQLRTLDLDRTGPVWRFPLQRHKTAHKGRERALFFGPEAQKVLQPFLLRVPLPDPQLPLFAPGRGPHAQGDARGYSTHSYSHALAMGLEAQAAATGETIKVWGPNRLRHSALTRLDRETTIDETRAVAGHSSTTMTRRYAREDQSKAAAVMAKHG